MTKKQEEQTDASGQVSRRRFAKTLAAALIAAPLTAKAQKTTKEAVAPPNPQPSPALPAASPMAEAYGEVARARFGDKLSAEQLTQVKSDLEGNVRTAERLRAAKLQNADEPDFVFAA